MIEIAHTSVVAHVCGTVFDTDPVGEIGSTKVADSMLQLPERRAVPASSSCAVPTDDKIEAADALTGSVNCQKPVPNVVVVPAVRVISHMIILSPICRHRPASVPLPNAGGVVAHDHDGEYDVHAALRLSSDTNCEARNFWKATNIR
jgi:hypothetical protein